MPTLATTAPPPKDVVPSFMPSLEMAQAKDVPALHKPPTSLHRYRYFVPNIHATLWVLVVDLDRPDGLSHLASLISHHGLPYPSYIVENADPASLGHVHAGWFIEPVATSYNARQAPIDFAADVHQALTNVYGGDQAYNAQGKALNPWWSGWNDPNNGRVIWGHVTPYKLGELRKGLVDAGVWDKRRPRPATGTPRVKPTSNATMPTPAEGRNEYVFHAVRRLPLQIVERNAYRLNDALSTPMRDSEVRGIVRSVHRYHGKSYDQTGRGTMSKAQRQQQAQRGAIGGAKNTDAQKAARAKGPATAAVVRSAESVGRYAQIRAYHEAGLTYAQIMERMGVSRDTVKRAMRATRKNA